MIQRLLRFGKHGMRRSIFCTLLMLLVATIFFSPFELPSASAQVTCPPGTTPVPDLVAPGVITCVPTGGVPEMPLMLVPAFLIAGGIAVRRVRRNTMRD